jgi:MFS family permease
MSKMVTDWFSGHEMATAMAIFVNSWPVGIALALVVLPPIATHGGVPAAFFLTSVLIIIGIVAIALLYRPAPGSDAGGGSDGAVLKGTIFFAVMTAGLIWGLYNASIGMIFSFAPSLLNERGWPVAAASSATSVVLWLAALSVPFGGFLADRTGHHRTVLLGGFVALGTMLVVAARTDAVLPVFVGLGLVSGLSAGPIMSLPNRVLAPEARAVGMGVFYTLFYLVLVVAAWVGGLAASRAGTAQVTFDLGAVMLGACCVAWWIFEQLAARAPRVKSTSSVESGRD